MGYVIRKAEPRDQKALAELKSQYIRAVYRGFFSKEVMARIDDEFYVPEFGEYIASEQLTTIVMEHEGRLEGYVVYGPDAEEPGWGLIYDARTVHPGDAERKRILIERTVNALSDMGYPDIHIWLVHDNFRVRFLFESFGFRRDGTEKQSNRSGQDLYVVRYQYHVRKNDEDEVENGYADDSL